MAANKTLTSVIHITFSPSRAPTLPLVGLGGLAPVVAAALPARLVLEAVLKDVDATDWGAIAEGCELGTADRDVRPVDDAEKCVRVPDAVETRVLVPFAVVFWEAALVNFTVAEVAKGRLEF